MFENLEYDYSDKLKLFKSIKLIKRCSKKVTYLIIFDVNFIKFR